MNFSWMMDYQEMESLKFIIFIMSELNTKGKFVIFLVNGRGLFIEGSVDFWPF